jgi:hypothetical protein
MYFTVQKISLTFVCSCVVPAALDWSLDLVTYPMSIMLAAGGISAAIVGKWTLKVSSLGHD